jgi:uncharacterized protein DUF2252
VRRRTAIRKKQWTATFPYRSTSEASWVGRVVPRSALAELVGSSHRPDPITLLEFQATSRIPELVPIRYGRTLASPWAFFRGAALIMASELGSGPHTGLNVQLCGDAHLCNFGLFGSAKRKLVFDINDFDETLPGPWEWDVSGLRRPWR